MEHYADFVDFVRNIRGAGASILWILLLSGRQLTNRELRRATSYSGKTVADALAWLESRGYVQNNGRVQGWSLGPSFQMLTLHLEKKERPFSVAVEMEPYPASENGQIRRRISVKRKFSVKKSDSDSDLAVADVDHSEYISQQQSANQQENWKNGLLGAVLERAGIQEPALSQLSVRSDLETAVVQAWYWFALTQTKLDNPQGFVIRRLKDGHDPPESFLGLARAWPDVSQDQKEALLLAATGDDQGLRLHGPAESARELRYWLGDEPAAEWETAVLEAYLSLARYAPDELRY